ncbi:hypothetical protein [Phaffia rhodozyma]|uniref:Uncharacterized protein n=1 Tax=Phaffia rhodozyma TaxID=264483 RepID=A0A0F7SVE5_PHARH|nr:hypothetical protein [Phaffia rhodozyma]
MSEGLPPLELFISTSLESSLGAPVSEDNIEYIARLVEEEALEDEDKIEAVRGILETEFEGREEVVIEQAVLSILEEHRRLLAEIPSPTLSESESSESEDDDSSNNPAIQDPAFQERLRKALLIQQYGLVEDDSASSYAVREGGPGPGEGKKPAEGGIDEALLRSELKRMSMKKKTRKKYDSVNEDYFASGNLNREKMKYEDAQKRAAAKATAAEKKVNDKAGYAKQKADQQAKLEARRKKAAKGERRG